MNKATSLSIGFAVLAAVAFVSYRIWSDQAAADVTPTTALSSDERAQEKPKVDLGPETLQLPEARDLLSGGDDPSRVAGVVLQPDGQPASGAKVVLYRALSPWPEWRREPPLESVFTSVSGAFRFQTPRGPDLLVSYEHPRWVGDLVPADPMNPSLTLRLEPGFEVSGFVRNNIGAGMADVTVSLEPTLLDTRRARSQATDVTGYFRFTNVHAGSVRVVARHPLW